MVFYLTLLSLPNVKICEKCKRDAYAKIEDIRKGQIYFSMKFSLLAYIHSNQFQAVLFQINSG